MILRDFMDELRIFKSKIFFFQNQALLHSRVTEITFCAKNREDLNEQTHLETDKRTNGQKQTKNLWYESNQPCGEIGYEIFIGKNYRI